MIRALSLDVSPCRLVVMYGLGFRIYGFKIQVFRV